MYPDEDDCFNASYVRALFSKMMEYLASGKFTDVNVACGNQVFKCHRLILAAASEYFDKIFSGKFVENSASDIALHNIDSVAFEAILGFIYRGGVVHIDDENVYSVLCASEILQLKSIEDQCIRYLIERSIPPKYALELFLYACLKKKNSLIPTISRFVLEHLSRFCCDNAFMKISLEELKTLLTHFRPSSVKKENLLLNTVFRYVSHITGTHENKKSLFESLMENIQFQHISPEQVTEYFDKNITKGCDEIYDVDESATSNLDLSLYIYVNTNVKRYPGQEIREINSPRSNLLTLQKSNDDIDWSFSRVVEPIVDIMRTVTLDGRLYSLRLQKERFSFDVHSSVNLSAGAQSLTPPFNSNNIKSYCICCDENNRSIYACNSDYRSNARESLFIYNCDLDQWNSVTVVDRECKPAIVTYHDNRLYLIGNKGSSEVRAYDHRSGKLEKLANSMQFHGASDDCCSHKEKIYVSQTSDIYSDVDCENPSLTMEVYDPVAGKWNIIEWKSTGSGYAVPNTDGLMPIENSHRLISFDNRLWMFHSYGSPERDISLVRVYDSYREKWKASDTLHGAIWNQIYSADDLHEDTCVKYSVRDVVAFKL